MLAQEGVDVNTQDYNGRTPLHAAARFRNVELLNLLLAQKAIDVNLQDNERCTPLHVAVTYSAFECVESLLTVSNINVNIKDKWKSTPLTCAGRLKPPYKYKISKLLIKHGGKPGRKC